MDSDPAAVILRGVELFNRGEFEAAVAALGGKIEWDTTGAVPDGTVYLDRARAWRTAGLEPET